LETSELLDEIRHGFLFDIKRRHRRGLSQGKITDELYKSFLDKGCMLTTDARVEAVRKGKEWRIIDGVSHYLLVQVRDFIRVRLDVEVMTRKDLAKKLGTTPGAITRLAKGSLKLSKGMADALVRNLFVSDWLADQIMFCAARDALSAVETRRDKAVAVLIKREFAGYPNVLKWIQEQTEEE
jgi:transcriptional regulator with XRE-family HTH domain